MTTAEALRADDTVECQIAHATLRLRRYRVARDQARAKRLEDAPRLASLIASVLEGVSPHVPKH